MKLESAIPNDRLGARKALREPGIVALQLSHLAGERVGFGGFRAAFGGTKGAESTSVPLSAPFAEG